MKNLIYMVAAILSSTCITYYLGDNETYKKISKILFTPIVTIGPIVLFIHIYLTNKKIVSYLNNGQEVPLKYLRPHPHISKFFTVRNLRTTGGISLLFAILWTFLSIYLLFYN